MPAAIPLIASVAAGAAAANGDYVIPMAITIAPQVSTQMMTKKPSLGSPRETAGRKHDPSRRAYQINRRDKGR